MSPAAALRGSGWPLALASLLFLVVPASTLKVGEAERQVAEFSENSDARELRNQSAFAVILGEFRTNLSDLIFIKTERYLHSGVAYEPHLDMAEMEKSGTAQAKQTPAKGPAPAENAEEDDHHHEGEHSHDHAHDHDGEELKSLIKPPDEDFRGFVGNLEREVKPWLPPGSPDYHTSGTELLPWYRLATLGNPRNERAYMVGAWWLKSLASEEQAREAIQFLNEGIKNNSRSFQLYLMRGYIERQLDLEKESRESFLKSAEIVIKVRPPEGKTSETWTDHMEEQADAALTMAVLTTRDQVSPKAALELIDSYEKAMGSLPLVIVRIRNDLKAAAGAQ